MDIIRKRVGSQCVKVTLPELVQLSSLSRLFSLKALLASHPQTGLRPSRLLARGMEFAESRRYQLGDDIRSIDWRVTARTGRPHTKLFTAEKERQVVLCVDMSSPMFFATQGVFKSVQASLIAGCLAWNARHQGDKVGSISFNDHEIFEIKPSNRSKSLLSTLDRLAFLSTHATGTGNKGSVTLKQALGSLSRLIKPGGLGVVISDFSGMTKDCRELLVQLSRSSEIFLIMIEDPFDFAIPQRTSLHLTDKHRDMRISTFDKLALNQFHQRHMERKHVLMDLGKHKNIRFYCCRTDEDCLDLLTNNFR